MNKANQEAKVPPDPRQPVENFDYAPSMVSVSAVRLTWNEDGSGVLMLFSGAGSPVIIQPFRGAPIKEITNV